MKNRYDRSGGNCQNEQRKIKKCDEQRKEKKNKLKQISNLIEKRYENKYEKFNNDLQIDYNVDIQNDPNKDNMSKLLQASIKNIQNDDNLQKIMENNNKIINELKYEYKQYQSKLQKIRISETNQQIKNIRQQKNKLKKQIAQLKKQVSVLFCKKRPKLDQLINQEAQIQILKQQYQLKLQIQQFKKKKINKQTQSIKNQQKIHKIKKLLDQLNQKQNQLSINLSNFENNKFQENQKFRQKNDFLLQKIKKIKDQNQRKYSYKKAEFIRKQNKLIQLNHIDNDFQSTLSTINQNLIQSRNIIYHLQNQMPKKKNRFKTQAETYQRKSNLQKQDISSLFLNKRKQSMQRNRENGKKESFYSITGGDLKIEDRKNEIFDEMSMFIQHRGYRIRSSNKVDYPVKQ